MVSEPRSSTNLDAGQVPASNRPQEPESHQERTSDGYRFEDLHWTTSGSSTAPPVLLLHGWGSSAENMAIIARALEEEYRVVNVDLPGHGFSPAPTEPLGVPEHATLVARLIREHLGGSAAVIGHSNGGRIALFMASSPEYKRLITRMVLISPSGVTPRRSAGYYVRRTVADVLKAPFAILPEPLKDFGLDWLRHSLVWRLLGSTDYRALEGAMRETFVRTVTHHLDDRVRQVGVPTLLIWGDQDTAISRRQMAFLEDNIPDAGLVVLEGAGHYGYLDDFSTFIAATRHFLSAS